MGIRLYVVGVLQKSLSTWPDTLSREWKTSSLVSVANWKLYRRSRSVSKTARVAE